jgi:hypothetical protein
MGKGCRGEKSTPLLSRLAALASDEPTPQETPEILAQRLQQILVSHSISSDAHRLKRAFSAVAGLRSRCRAAGFQKPLGRRTGEQIALLLSIGALQDVWKLLTDRFGASSAGFIERWLKDEGPFEGCRVDLPDPKRVSKDVAKKLSNKWNTKYLGSDFLPVAQLFYGKSKDDRNGSIFRLWADLQRPPVFSDVLEFCEHLIKSGPTTARNSLAAKLASPNRGDDGGFGSYEAVRGHLATLDSDDNLREIRTRPYTQSTLFDDLERLGAFSASGGRLHRRV